MNIEIAYIGYICLTRLIKFHFIIEGFFNTSHGLKDDVQRNLVIKNKESTLKIIILSLEIDRFLFLKVRHCKKM